MITFNLPPLPAGSKTPWIDRARASGTHLVLSAMIGLIVAALVFTVWYPSPYRDLVGGRELFMIVMGVDLVMGPALTFVAFNRTKTFNHLARDLATIGVLQVAALGFGLHTVFLARPVHINFEIDRLRIVTAADIDLDSLKDAPAELREFPITGPIVIASVKPIEPKAQIKSMELAMAGFDLSQQPNTWKVMDKPMVEKMWNKATAIDALRAKLALRKNGDAKEFENFVKSVKFSAGESLQGLEIRFIPLTSKRAIWTAMVTKNGTIQGAAPIDMFD